MNYKSPPITEAVIGITFSSPISDDVIGSLIKKFNANYPDHQNVSTLDVALDVKDQKKPKADISQKIGHRLSTADMTQLLILWPTSFTFSQLAPYPGWEHFIERFVRDWRMLKRVVGYQQISRVGVRYINRVDIPATEPIIEHEKFLNVYPKLPDLLNPLDAYGLQAVIQLPSINCVLKLNSARVPSPILDYASFVLDLDISNSVNPPQNDDDILELLNKIRLQKNSIFEACISNPSRELFQ
jgi:uncharacterized protein (TIGR04255 family)